MAPHAIATPAARRVSWWPARSTRWSWVIVLCIILAAVWWSFFSIRAVKVGEAFSDDLAHNWQTVWNVAHGNGFQHSHIPLHHNAPRLATHADYILILLAPLAWLWPNFAALMTAQAVIVAVGAWFIWLLGRRWLRDEALAAVVAICYLLSGMVQFPVWWQFHGVTLSLTFILALAEAIAARRRWWVVALWFTLALITKEQVGFILGPLAFWVCWKSEQRRMGWWLLGAGVGYSLLHYLFILPHFAPQEMRHVFWVFYFGSLGTTPQTILPKLLQPHEWWGRLWEMRTLDVGIVLLVPTILLPLFEPLILLAGLALLPHMLSDQYSVNSAYAQNHVLAVPIIWIATISVLRRMQARAWWTMLRPMIIVTFLMFAIMASILRSPNPWSVAGSNRRWLVDQELPTIQRWLATVPSNEVVGYSWGLPPYAQNRQTVYVLPHGIQELDVAVVHIALTPKDYDFESIYYTSLLQYFDHDPAFTMVYRSRTTGIYRRLPNQTPGPLPATFVDPTPSWTERCTPICPSWNPID